jgi:hypothetical protein
VLTRGDCAADLVLAEVQFLASRGARAPEKQERSTGFDNVRLVKLLVLAPDLVAHFEARFVGVYGTARETEVPWRTSYYGFQGLDPAHVDGRVWKASWRGRQARLGGVCLLPFPDAAVRLPGAVSECKAAFGMWTLRNANCLSLNWLSCHLALLLAGGFHSRDLSCALPLTVDRLVPPFCVQASSIDTEDVAGQHFLAAAEGLPLVLLSANGGTAEVLKGVRVGAVDFLERPLSPLKLRNVWQHVVRKVETILSVGVSPS